MPAVRVFPLAKDKLFGLRRRSALDIVK